MVIQSSGNTYSATRTSRIGRGSLLLKTCWIAFSLAIVFLPQSYVRNMQRNLTRSIQNEERRQARLRIELDAARESWETVQNASRMERILASQGVDMTIPSAEQIVMVTPVHGVPSAAPMPHGRAPNQAVAAR